MSSQPRLYVSVEDEAKNEQLVINGSLALLGQLLEVLKQSAANSRTARRGKLPEVERGAICKPAEVKNG